MKWAQGRGKNSFLAFLLNVYFTFVGPIFLSAIHSGKWEPGLNLQHLKSRLWPIDGCNSVHFLKNTRLILKRDIHFRFSVIMVLVVMEKSAKLIQILMEFPPLV